MVGGIPAATIAAALSPFSPDLMLACRAVQSTVSETQCRLCAQRLQRESPARQMDLFESTCRSRAVAHGEQCVQAVQSALGKAVEAIDSALGEAGFETTADISNHEARQMMLNLCVFTPTACACLLAFVKPVVKLVA